MSTGGRHVARRPPTRSSRRFLATGPGAEPDGVHAGVPHHPRVDGCGLPGDDADRQLQGPAPQRRGRPPPRRAMVEGLRGADRRRRGHWHGALVRVRAPVACLHGPLRRRVRDPVRDRGDLLLHRGDLHRDLYLRLEAPVRMGALLDRRARLRRGPRRRILGRRRQRVDESARRLRSREGRHGEVGRPRQGDLQPRGPVRGAAHDPRGVHRDRVPDRVRLRGRNAPWAARPPPPPGPADPPHRRVDRGADPVRRRGHRGPCDRHRPAGQVRGDGVQPDHPPARDRVHLRDLHGRWGEGRDRHPRLRLVPRRLQHRHEGQGLRHRPGDRPPAVQHDAPLGVRHHGRDLQRDDRARRVARLGLVAPPRHPEDPLVPARGGDLRHRRGRRARVRLDRDRGRATTLDRLRRHADEGRRHRGERGLGDLRRLARHLHRPRCRDRADPANDESPLAQRRCRGGRACPYGPSDPVPPASEGSS